MARPSPTDIESTGEGWDAFVDANFDLCFVTPIPVGEYASVGSLPAANAYDRCIAVVTSENRIAFSDGSTWNLIPIEGAAIVSLTNNVAGAAADNTIDAITDPADAPATADALRDDLVANTIPDIRNAIEELAVKLNEILTTLRTSNAINT